MTDNVQHNDSSHFYKLTYFILPFPIVASVIFMAYVLMIKDSQITTYCTVADKNSAYEQASLRDADFVSLEKLTLDRCKEKDFTIDADDGRLAGKVRWFECNGTVCGPGWQTILKQN